MLYCRVFSMSKWNQCQKFRNVQHILIHEKPNNPQTVSCQRFMSSIRFRYPFQQNGRRRSFFRSSRNRNTSWYGDLGNVNIKGDGSNGALLKAAVFTGTFSIGSFVAATILEYENTRHMMLEKARQAKLSWLFRKRHHEPSTNWQKFKRDCKRIWDKLSPGDKIFAPLCALNILVFGAWHIPNFRPVMVKYFCSNPASRAICWPMFLSTFSHYSALHLFANMYVLRSFTNAGVISLGKEQFLAVYMSAGVVASLSSIMYKTLLHQPGISLGASGAIMAVLAYACTTYPNTQLSVLFLPMMTFPAGAAIKVLMGIDLAGCIMGWKFFDHAAHLGGALFGLFWAYYGIDMWQKRIPYINIYHDWRKTRD